MKDKSTYSMWRAFRNCRRKYWWRYVRCLVRIERDPTLVTGAKVHELLRMHHGRTAGEPAPDFQAVIDQSYPRRDLDLDVRSKWHIMSQMIESYVQRYASEDFRPTMVEFLFSGEIVNPETGATSRSFTLDGKVDMIVIDDHDRHWIVEHKTASVIDRTYLEALWTDFQITLYSYYVAKGLKLPIAGVIYNILGKPRLRQGAGETEEEFTARRAELIAKSKTGTSKAKRRMPETDEEFRDRLRIKFAEDRMFHREAIYIPKGRTDILQAELWELTQAMLDARRRDVWYQNTDHCYWFRKPCEYLPLCRTDDPEPIIANLYEQRVPHEELEDGETTGLIGQD